MEANYSSCMHVSAVIFALLHYFDRRQVQTQNTVAQFVFMAFEHFFPLYARGDECLRSINGIRSSGGDTFRSRLTGRPVILWRWTSWAISVPVGLPRPHYKEGNNYSASVVFTLLYRQAVGLKWCSTGAKPHGADANFDRAGIKAHIRK